jgi:hypothetical protein
MMPLTINIKPDLKNPDVINKMMADAVFAVLSKIKQIEEALADIRDPDTGKGAKVSWAKHDDGIKVLISGSPFVRAEAERRISALPKQP